MAYYLVNLTADPATQQQRLQTVRDRVPDGARRVLAHQRLHWRRSINGQWLIVEADTDQAEHAWLLDRAWVSGAGSAADARAYVAARRAEWDPPRGLR